jgi:hypothetical protein
MVIQRPPMPPPILLDNNDKIVIGVSLLTTYGNMEWLLGSVYSRHCDYRYFRNSLRI